MASLCSSLFAYSLYELSLRALPRDFHSDNGSEYNIFYQKHFNPWLSLHRPCMFATNKVNPKGKVVKIYKHEDVKTPLEALVLLNKLGLVKFKTLTMLADLLAQAKQKTDLAAAQEMQQAKHELFDGFAKQKRRA